jgi:hypothetical protein
MFFFGVSSKQPMIFQDDNDIQCYSICYNFAILVALGHIPLNHWLIMPTFSVPLKEVFLNP